MLGRREFVEKASTPRKKNARLVRYLSENSSNATKEKKASERPIAHKLPTGFGSIAELPTSPVRKGENRPLSYPYFRFLARY